MFFNNTCDIIIKLNHTNKNGRPIFFVIITNLDRDIIITGERFKKSKIDKSFLFIYNALLD